MFHTKIHVCLSFSFIQYPQHINRNKLFSTRTCEDITSGVTDTHTPQRSQSEKRTKHFTQKIEKKNTSTDQPKHF